MPYDVTTYSKPGKMTTQELKTYFENEPNPVVAMGAQRDGSNTFVFETLANRWPAPLNVVETDYTPEGNQLICSGKIYIEGHLKFVVVSHRK